MAFSYADLAARAGVDPWTLRDDLAAGSPVEITAMARAFARAGGDAELAAQLTREGADLLAQGYTVDATSVVDAEDHVARTRAQLGNDGEDLRRVARILDTVSDDLETSTADAQREVAALEAALRTIDRDYQQTARNLPEEDRQILRDGALADAVEEVRTRGGTVRGWHEAYDEGLARHLRTLADLGYVPPDDADLGSDVGDVSPEQAQRDGAAVRAAVEGAPGAAGLETVGDASRTVTLLNAKAAAGVPLSAEETAYLEAYYDAIGADTLADLPAWARAGADPSRGPDGSPTRTADEAVRAVVTPIADGIMTLSDQPVSQPGHLGQPIRDRGLDDMPRAVQDLARQQVGWRDPHTGILWPAEHVDGYPSLTTVDGLARYQGFGDLLAASTVDGGDRFTTEVGQEALRVKQDLNAISGIGSNALRFGMGTPAEYDALRAATSDAAVSDVLGVVGRNEDASAALLTDETSREAVLGLNWTDESGAAAVVRGGTDRDPTGGGGTRAQADAALAVIREVGGDRDAYLGRMGEGVEDAVTDVGISYVDMLGRPPGDGGSWQDGEDTLGRPTGPGFDLTADERDRYLQFVAGTAEGEWTEDDTPRAGNDAVRFQAAAAAYSTALLTQAFQSGDPAGVNATLDHVGRLDGAITQGTFDYSMSGTAQEDDQKAATHRADSTRNLAWRSGVGIGVAVVGTGVSVMSGGTAVPAVVGITSAVVNNGAGAVFRDDVAPPAELPATRDDLFRTDAETYVVGRDQLIVTAAVNAGVVDPADLPAGLATRGPDGGWQVAAEDRLTGSQVRQDLGMAADRAVLGFEGTSGADVDLARYDGGRGQALTGTQDRAPDQERPPTEGGSSWSSENGARSTMYGRNVPPSGEVESFFETVVPVRPVGRDAPEHARPEYYRGPL